jgi:hypothetical protein
VGVAWELTGGVIMWSKFTIGGVIAAVALAGFVLLLRPNVAHGDDGAPPPSGDTLVVLDEAGTSQGEDPPEGLFITPDRDEFAAAVEAYMSAGSLAGAAVIAPDGPIDPNDPPAYVQGWATVYDQATLDMWNQTGFEPAFVDGVVVDEVDISEAVFDLDVVAPNADGDYYHLKARVRASDGAVAVVFYNSCFSSVILAQAEGRCNAGWWWQHGKICCHTQMVFCSLARQLLGPILGPCICGNCNTCYQQCLNCAVSNPCHSCDPCGLSIVLCYWFGYC